MDRHDNGERAVSFRLEEEDGDRLAVEALEAMKARLDAAFNPTEVGELARFAGREVVYADLLRLGRRREAERDLRAVRREDEVVGDAVAGEREVVAA